MLKKMLKKIVLSLWIISISCKNNAQGTLTELPVELANKTWIYISKNEADSYKEILNSLNQSPESNSIKTGENNISLEVTDYGEYATIDIKSIIANANGFNMKSDGFVDFINFLWIDKNKGIASWKIKYNKYSQGGGKIVDIYMVNKDFVTSENFPESELPKITLEEKQSINKLKYIEVEEDLPIKGYFSCLYNENEYKNGGLILSNKDQKIHNGDTGEILTLKYSVSIELVEYLNIDCIIRKVKDKPNTYALFFRSFIDTKYSIPEVSYYSDAHPIAEIEILDNNTIKKQWLGIYNRKTKEYENVEGFGWDDECDGIIKRGNKL